MKFNFDWRVKYYLETLTRSSSTPLPPPTSVPNWTRGTGKTFNEM